MKPQDHVSACQLQPGVLGRVRFSMSVKALRLVEVHQKFWKERVTAPRLTLQCC